MAGSCGDKLALEQRVLASAKRQGSGMNRQTSISVLAECEDSPHVCWICLDTAGPDKPLLHPCNCPSYTHAGCIARWQLQSAGTRREQFCDFCNSHLPSWKDVLTPQAGTRMPAVMNVNFDNKTYSFEVSPGPDGYHLFTRAIRKAFSLPGDSELNITFTCDEPSSGSLLTLQGAGAYDAAVHCASVSAARRLSSSGSPRASSSGGGGRSSNGCDCSDSDTGDDSELVFAPPASAAGPSASRGSASGSRPTAGRAAGGSRRASSDGGARDLAGGAVPGHGASGAAASSSSSSSSWRKLRSALNELLALR